MSVAGEVYMLVVTGLKKPDDICVCRRYPPGVQNNRFSLNMPEKFTIAFAAIIFFSSGEGRAHPITQLSGMTAPSINNGPARWSRGTCPAARWLPGRCSWTVAFLKPGITIPLRFLCFCAGGYTGVNGRGT